VSTKKQSKQNRKEEATFVFITFELIAIGDGEEKRESESS